MASPLLYDGALTCALKVKDLHASILWYQDVLGFRLLYRLDDMRWCELATETPRVNVGLSEVEDLGPRGGGAVLTFGVEDIDAARRQLENRDVRFDGPTQTIQGLVKLAAFYDPDGNPFMLSENLQSGHEVATASEESARE